MLTLALPFWQQALRGIGAVVCGFIYSLISWVYQLFITVSRLNILSSDEIGPIYQRVTMILTIVMVFYITFEFVKYVVQPENISSKDKGVGNVAMRMVIVIILIAFVPKIFTLAYQLQNKLIETQVFSKIILGKTNSNYDTFGSDFSANMLSLFYGIDEEACDGKDCSQEQMIVENNLAKLRTEGKVNITTGISESNKIRVNGESEDVAIIKFDGLMAILVGGFILYILVLYSIDVGTRYAQMLFLQIISPVAIMGYLSPKKDGIFQKWLKQCLTTYLDLFIRLAIIYFVLLVIDVLGDPLTGNIFEGLGDVSTTLKVFTYIVLVMGLLVFANRAPKLLQELFPSSGAAGIGFGLKGGDRVAPMAARAIGAGAGGLSTMARKGLARAVGEVGRRKRIQNELLEAGKPTDRRSMKQALRADRTQARTARSSYQKARKDLENSQERKDLLKAESELNDAVARGLKGEKLNPYKQNVSRAKEKFEAKRNGQYAQAQRTYQQASSKLAETKNQGYGTPIGLQVAGAALGGLVSGVKTGSQATKLGDVSKKVQEAGKQVADKEQSRLQTLEAGADPSLVGTITQKVTGIQQKMGIKTEAERIKLNVKDLETDAKRIDAQISMESNIKKGQDSAEDRASGKIKKHEQKTQIKAEDRDSKTFVIKVDGQEEKILTYDQATGKSKTTSEVFMDYEQKANTARAQAEAANAELIKAEMEGRATDEMRTVVAAKSKEAELAKYREEQVLKKLKEYAITRALRGDLAEGEADAVLLNNIEAMRQAVENARNNVTTIQYLENLVVEGKLKSSTLDAFKNNNITTFDDYDAIQGFLTGHTGQLSSAKNSITETIRAINESAATDAANANAAASGSKK